MFISKASYLLLIGLLGLLLLINPVVALSFDDIYLHPKVLWIYVVILPSASLLLWQRRQDLVRNRNLIIFGLFFSWLSLTSFISSPFNLSLWGALDRADGLLMHGVYVLTLLAGFVWRPALQSPVLQLTIIGMVTALALTNILQQLQILGIPGAEAFAGVAATLFGGTQGNRGYMGGTLALLLPAIICLATNEQRPSLKWLLILSVTIVTWALAGTITRAAWIAGVIGVLALFWWNRPSRNVWPFLLAGVTAFTLTAEIKGNERAFGKQTQGITDSSGRSVLWDSALIGIQQKPVLGWGQQALWKVMAERDTSILLRGLITPEDVVVKRLSNDPTKPPSFIVQKSDGRKLIVSLPINKVHNEYLDYALTYGIPAALFFIIILGSAIWFGRKTVPGVAAGLAAYAIYLFFWPEIIRFAPLAWFMMGIALNKSLIQQRASSVTSPASPSLVSPPP